MDPTKENFCYFAKNFNQLQNLINNYSRNNKDFNDSHKKNREKIKNTVFTENNIEKLIKLIAN